jgi:hypothetical protein
MLPSPSMLSPKKVSFLTPKELRKNKRKLSLEAIINLLRTTDIEDLPDQIDFLHDQFNILDCLNKPDKNLENLLKDFNFSVTHLNILLLKLYHINSLPKNSIAHKVTSNIQLLMRIILKQKILAGEDYAPMLEKLQTFKIMNQLTVTERICRYFICLNAALSSGTVFYEMATSLLLSVLVITLSGIFSLIVCGFLANYFINISKEEDEKLISELESHKHTIDFLAGRESIIRLRCYNLITQIIKLHKEFQQVLGDEKPDDAIALLINNWNDTNPLATIDEYISSRSEKQPLEVSTVAEINNIHFKTFNSIYSRTFQSNWGPVISFLGGAGTLFFIAKTVLAIAGLVTLAGSSIGLLAVLAGASIIFSSVFALQHRALNLHLDNCKNEINDFKTNDLDEFKIRIDQLKRTRIELLIDFTNVQQLIRKNFLYKLDPVIAAEVESKISKNISLSNDGTYAGSRLILFHRPSVLVAPINDLDRSVNERLSGAALSSTT